MLELPSFGHMITSTRKFKSRDKIMLVRSRTEITTSKPLFQKTFILRWPRVANFADIIKIETMLIKTTFKDSNKLKELETISLSRYERVINHTCRLIKNT